MKRFNFIIIPSYSGFNAWENPLSSMYVTLTKAWKWAELLLNINFNADAVIFKAENGRKEYRLDNRHKGRSEWGEL
jgi:hypothetical protein